jgi:arylformamidase
MEIFDISQTLREGMAVWPGDEEFAVRWSMQIRAGASCNVSCLKMSAHTGTHLDAPYHFDNGGADIAAVDLSRYIGPARVVEMNVGTCIRAADLSALDWAGVERVLFRTRASEVCEGEWDRGFSYLAEDAAELIGGKRIQLVGTDAPSVDEVNSKDLPTHKTLLRCGIAILEGVRLAHVVPGDYELVCLPLKLAGLDGSPVRAILRR